MQNGIVELKYFCDIIPERADKAAAKYSGIAVYDYRELLDKDDLDAVSVCVPNGYHAPISIDFMRAGKDVLCEKPAADNLANALKMQECAEQTGRILSIGMVNRFDETVNRVKAHIDAGDLGNIYNVYISFRCFRSIPGLGGPFTTKAASGGGVLIDYGVHFIDLALYCLGDPKPLTVSGQTFSEIGKDIPGYSSTVMWAEPRKLDGIFDVDDSVSGFIRTEGASMTLNGAWAQNIFEREMFVDFMGDKAGIRMQYRGKYTMYTAKNGELFTVNADYTYDPSYSSDMMVTSFDKEIASFVHSIRTREKSIADISNAVETSRIMQGLYDSSESRREIVF